MTRDHINGESPDFDPHQILQPGRFTGPVRGGGLAGEPPAGDDGRKGWFDCLPTLILLAASAAGAVWGLVEAGLAVAKAVA